MNPRPLPSVLLAAVLLLAAPLLAAPASAQVHASESPAPRVPEQPAQPPQPMDRDTPASAALVGPLAGSHVFHPSEIPARTSPNGSETRAIVHGALRTGEPVGIHQSTQPAGTPPVALHVIHHSELICVQSGQLAFDHQEAGKLLTDPAGAGDIIYVAEGTLHRVRNTGSTPATYTVIAIGGDAK